ncbi:MAG: hypothetical protein M5U09_19675 [Gammaproteobacteria bacterium]|nr:hypothetical protein [Gammaproteobacteria bacterium]
MMRPLATSADLAIVVSPPPADSSAATAPGAARVVRSVEDAAGRDALGDDYSVDDDVHRRAEAVDAAAAGSVGNLPLPHLDLGVLEEDDGPAVHEFDRGAGVGTGGNDAVALEDGLAGAGALP